MSMLVWARNTGVLSCWRVQLPACHNSGLFALSVLPQMSFNITAVLGVDSLTLDDKLMEQNSQSMKENHQPTLLTGLAS